MDSLSGSSSSQPYRHQKGLPSFVVIVVVAIFCLSVVGCSFMPSTSQMKEPTDPPFVASKQENLSEEGSSGNEESENEDHSDESAVEVDNVESSEEKDDSEDDIQDIVEPDTACYYQDGFLMEKGKTPDFAKDVKSIVTGTDENTLIDYPKGYRLRYPSDMQADFRYSPDFTRIYSDDLEFRISRDISPYSDVAGWLSDLPNSYVANEKYIQANGLSIHENTWVEINGRQVRLFSLSRTPPPQSTYKKNAYTYAYINTDGLTYYTFHFKSTSFEKNKDTIYQILESFEVQEPKGEASYNLSFEPKIPKWNQETAALYDKICASDHITWGFFTPNPFSPEGKEKIKEVEEKLDFQFPVILWYRYMGHDFPLEGMQEAYENGKIVELTYQIVGGAYDRNPNFDVLDGLKDDEIRRFAKQAKEFGHPFLFRLNNEMNSTWVSYSGHLSLCDPDIFVQVWRRVYDLFQEEGVDNAIWIFNPNDVSYPPCKWNSHTAYYPGNGYVHMIGLTGYNTGTYFQDLTGERWRSFTEIYDRLWRMYSQLYAKFPWIITEFSCSSVGGDKEAWINEMFENLPRYKNIKIAVWWSYYDPDPRPEHEGTPARRYWLDEKPEYIEAFKKGLHQTQP